MEPGSAVSSYSDHLTTTSSGFMSCRLNQSSITCRTQSSLNPSTEVGTIGGSGGVTAIRPADSSMPEDFLERKTKSSRGGGGGGGGDHQVMRKFKQTEASYWGELHIWGPYF